MNASVCYLCGGTFTAENRSAEHLFPNSIGGRLKSERLLCKGCNGATGQLYDPNFAMFANILASKYKIGRERGHVQNEIGVELETGREVVVKPGFRVDYLHPEISQIGENEKLITASTAEGHRHAINRLKKEAERSGLEIEFGPTTTDHTPRPINFTVNKAVNQDAVLRSACKTLCNFYYRQTNDRHFIAPLIDFITSDMDNQFAWFCDLQLVHAQNPGKPYHLVIIKGDKKKKALIGYFEIFGEKGFISLMHGRYTGPELLLAVTYDPIQHFEVPSVYTFDVNVGQLIQHILARPQL